MGMPSTTSIQGKRVILGNPNKERVIFDWAKIKRGKGNFRAQKGLEKNTSYQQLIKTTIKSCLIEYLEDDTAREYLTGKMDNLDKLVKTRDNLTNEEVSEVTSASIITLEEEIKKLSDELPDNMSLLTKIKKTNYSNILEYVLFQLQRATINFTKKNKIEENNTRNELVSELDEALNDEANGIDNHELIQELQNSLSAIDVEKEQEYLKNKTSWDILVVVNTVCLV